MWRKCPPDLRSSLCATWVDFIDTVQTVNLLYRANARVHLRNETKKTRTKNKMCDLFRILLAPNISSGHVTEEKSAALERMHRQTNAAPWLVKR